MITHLETLTDYEIDGLHKLYCLADGHAYQDLHPSFKIIVESLPEIWHNAAEQSIPDMEKSFSESFSSFIGAPALENYKNFKICPTASNSIDLVGAMLRHLKFNTVMIEPTFDNLALLLKRRGVNLNSVSDIKLFSAAEANEIDKVLPELKTYQAIVLVNPNNPTGLYLSENGFRNIVHFCVRNNMTLVVDNCFRIYNRNPYNDYQILIESQVSFISFEDTGKVWPTQDLKASLIYFSNDLKNLFSELYNEVYLCVSNFTLGLLSAFFNKTANVGIKETIWDIVDARRLILREAIKESPLSVTQISMNSTLPVEWLSCFETYQDDLTLCQNLKQFNLAVLPGRQFYWNSSQSVCNQKYIRISFMKRQVKFLNAISILENYCKDLILNQFKFSEAM